MIMLKLLLFTWFITFIYHIYRKDINISIYFNAIFKALKDSQLRSFWKYTIFAIEYIIAILISIFVLSSFYPAKWLKKTIRYIFIKD